MRHWINTISRSHVERGVAGGFTQADHGAATRLKRLQRGDRIVFYSPRADFPDGPPVQAFTAIGTIADDEPYQVDMTPEFHPWRRKVVFDAAQEAKIAPLIEVLGFLPDKKRWGFPFRRGLFEIPAADFAVIAEAMAVVQPAELAAV